MSIIRVIHNRENPYVQINKQALWNPRLSLKAIGLWAKCLSRPDDWLFHVNELARKGKDKQKAIYSAIDELERERYVLKLKHIEKKETGEFDGGGVQYIFFEFPYTDQERDSLIEELKKSFRHCPFGDVRRGGAPDGTLLKKDSTDPSSLRSEDIEKQKEREGALPPPPTPQASGDPPLFPAFKNIILKKEEFDQLVKEFGEPTVLEKMEALNDYRDLKPKEFKKYGKHALVLRNWIKKDLIKNKLEPHNNEASLNGAQKENFRLNEELVNELKVDYPDRAAMMTIFYKYHVLKSKDPEFDISMLIGHKEFCRFLEKHLRINILEVRFPNG